MDISGKMERQVQAVREALGDKVDILDVADVVENMLRSMEGDLSLFDIRLQNELQSIVEYIRDAKADLSALKPHVISGDQIPTATDQLDAVVAATEEATESILEAAEELEAMSQDLDGDAAAKLTDIATKIYEASNFQDVTGQRITKVVEILKNIEIKMQEITRAFWPEGEEPAHAVEGAADDGEVQRDLLQGPQLPDAAQSQDDIDALFESLD